MIYEESNILFSRLVNELIEVVPKLIEWIPF